MSTPGMVVLRRTWPQRIVMVMCLAVIGSALSAAWFTDDFYASVASIGRVEISGEVLRTETAPGEPVNFLLIGNDSALRLDPDDPVNIGRVYDPRGTFNADSITILRVDPGSSQAWILSLPRDLLVAVPGSGTWRINAALLIGGPSLLVETVTENFGIEINHYVELDFLAFRDVVDRLNGVPVWFDHAARDEGSGLNIPLPGCHVLDGESALAYVRARKYQEFIDGVWVSDGRNDFGRIERQQDFLVLALDRAIDRGARNPTTLASLIEAGAESVRLDTQLTPAELIDLGEAFSEFNPENLERLGLRVETLFDENGKYEGEELISDEGVFEVFRGASDLPPPADVLFDLYAPDQETLDGDGGLLESKGFAVVGRGLSDPELRDSVIVHPPGLRAHAETVARWLLPVPAVVEEPGAASMAVHLGQSHEQVTFLYPQDVGPTREAISARGDVGVPEPAATFAPAEPTPTDPPSTTAPTTTLAAPTDASTTSASPSVTVAPAPTSSESVEPAVTQEETQEDSSSRVRGRPPEGQSCG